MKKIALILIVPFLLTGCASVTYDLEIDKNLEIVEKVFITATSDYFNNFYKDYPKTIVTEWYQTEEIKNPLDNNNYNHELVEDGEYYPGVLVSKKFNSLSEYTNNTIFKGQTYKEIVSITNDNFITIKTLDFLPYIEDETDPRYSISKVTVNIKVPFIVTNHNADKYNSKTNTYTWNLNMHEDEKEIELTFDKNKVYVYNLVMYISISILILLLIILAFVFRYVIKKGKLNNRISE